MPLTTLSSKYQIVVPKSVREKLNLKSGQRLRVYSVDAERAIISKEPESYVNALSGLGKEVWDSLGGGELYIRKEREEWDR